MGLGGGVPARLWAFWVWTGKQWGLGGGGGVLGRGKDSEQPSRERVAGPDD